MKVNIIQADNIWDLEKEVNAILSKIDNSKIIDIKYSGIGNRAAYSVDRPSVMIIMK